jgi:hypothetical protein
MAKIPKEWHQYFWEVVPEKVDLEKHAWYIMGRVLEWGSLEAVRKLRRYYGDARLKVCSAAASARISAKPGKRFFLNSIPLFVALFFTNIRFSIHRQQPLGFSIVSVREIGAMKIMAIGDRGRKRDFVDLYFIARDLGLENVWHDFETKYVGTGYDSYHFLRALTYFADAETDEMPELISKATWKNVTKFFEKEIGKILL